MSRLFERNTAWCLSLTGERARENHANARRKALAVASGEGLLPFYDFPAAHWRSLWTTNPIEPTFATIRLRTAKTRNCLSEKTVLSLIHQFAMSAEKRRRRQHGFRHLAEMIAEVRFINGVDKRETGRGRRAAGFRTATHQI